MYFDGNPVDMATIIVAFLSCMIRPARRKFTGEFPGQCFNVRSIVIDFLNGTVVVPFLILIGTAFSKEMLKEALETNKIFFAIGGFIALVFVVREILHDASAA